MTDLSNKIKLNPKQLLYLPNPIDIDKTMQLGNLPVPSLPNNFIVFIGRLSKVKNLKLLLNAFQHIKHQTTDIFVSLRRLYIEPTILDFSPQCYNSYAVRLLFEDVLIEKKLPISTLYSESLHLK